MEQSKEVTFRTRDSLTAELLKALQDQDSSNAKVERLRKVLRRLTEEQIEDEQHIFWPEGRHGYGGRAWCVGRDHVVEVPQENAHIERVSYGSGEMRTRGSVQCSLCEQNETWNQVPEEIDE
jgi:hypothetical protein